MSPRFTQTTIIGALVAGFMAAGNLYTQTTAPLSASAYVSIFVAFVVAAGGVLMHEKPV